MRAARTRTEHGSQLIEMVTVMFLLGIVMTAVFSGFSSTQSALEGANSRMRNLDEARVLMAATSKDVRTAVRLTPAGSPFVLADKQEIVFYANLDTVSKPKKVRIYVDNTSELIEQVWDADTGSTSPNYTFTGTPSVRFVGRYVANDSANPIFTFLAADGSTLANYPLSDTDRVSIRAVRITLMVKRATTANVAHTTLTNRVRLPNLDYNAVAG